MNEISQHLNKLTRISFFNKENFDRDFFQFCSLIIGYFIIETVFSSVIGDFIFTLVDVLFNVFFLSYLFLNLKKQKKNFILLFILLKYIHFLFSISWSLAQFSSLFGYESIIIDAGLLLNIDVTFLNFVFSFFAGFLDAFMFLIYLRLIEYLLYKIPIELDFNTDLIKIFKNNYEIIRNQLSKTNFLGKIKVISLITVIAITPIAYTESMDTINTTNDGIFYLTRAISILVNFFGKNNILTQIVTTGNNYLGLKNTLYFSAKNLRLSAESLQSLNSPLYYPFLLLFGANSKVNNLITLVKELSLFIGGNMLDLVGSIQDYLNLMYQLTHEILRRAYWWNLEKYNISYNPKRDFFDKFNNQISESLAQNVQGFKAQYQVISTNLNNSILKGSSIINTFYSQMTQINDLFDQIIYLSRIAPPLLNATFFSVEVTNALAFDQFISARNLTNLSQQYINQAQILLENYTFSSGLSTAISDIGRVMNDINNINRNFVNMTANTENMFLSMAKLVDQLNETSYTNQNYLLSTSNSNQEINQSISRVKQIVDNNIQTITGYVNQNGNYVRFQFQDILKHFLWFYNGYSSAVTGYRDLWFSTNNTLNLFSMINNQQNATLSFINSYKNNSLLPDASSLDFQHLFTSYNTIQQYLSSTGNILNSSVTDGAIKVNKTLWENLLGFNTTKGRLFDKGFNKYLLQNFQLLENTLVANNFTLYYSDYDNYVNTSTNLLQSLSATYIFLSQSEQLPKN